MDVEIDPEPSAEERAAIEAAVAELYARGREPRSAWWHAGLLDEDDDRA